MTPHDRSALLRIYTSEQAKDGAKPLYEALVLRARDAGLAGATVLRGPLGFGGSARIHNAGVLDLSADLPLLIEIVDGEAALRAFASTLEGLRDVGLVTLSAVDVLHAKPRPPGGVDVAEARLR